MHENFVMKSTKKRISIVEDDEKKLLEIKNAFNQTNDLICISAYLNGEDALINIPKDQPEIVIMDIGLPHMNGVECMFRIKHKCPQILFLMYTIFANDEKVFDSLRFGADGYVLKRDGILGILESVRNLIDGDAPMSSEIAKKVIKSFHIANLECHLTPRQIEILELLSKGLLNKEIAEKLYLTVGTVKVQLARIYKKLQVNNRVEAINTYKGK